MNADDLPPPLPPVAAECLRALAEGERDLFTGDQTNRDAYLMSLRHFKAYEFARPLAGGREVLELGCGAGNGAVYLAQQASQVVAVDVEPQLVEALPRIWAEASVKWRIYDGGRLPFANRAFDLVTMFQVIEHVKDAAAMVAEIRRVLRPGGTLVLTTPNRTLRVAPGQRPWNPYHVREFWPWELGRLLRTAGFHDVQLFGLHGREDVVGPERRRTLRMLLGPYWMRLPLSLRRSMKDLAGGRPVTQAVAAASPISGATPVGAPEAPGPDVYRWTRRGLLWSLDILARGMR